MGACAMEHQVVSESMFKTYRPGTSMEQHSRQAEAKLDMGL